MNLLTTVLQSSMLATTPQKLFSQENLLPYLEKELLYTDILRLWVLVWAVIIVIIIIIMSCRQHGYPWHSLATSLYRSSPLAGLQGYILYPHIAAVCMFELSLLPLLGHMWGSIGVHHLWARPCFSSSVLHVLWFVRPEVIDSNSCCFQGFIQNNMQHPS